MCLVDAHSMIFGSSNPSKTGLGEINAYQQSDFQIESNWYSEERFLITHASETWQHIFDANDTRAL